MRKLTIVFGLLLVFSLVIYLWLQHGLSAVNPTDNTPTIFVVQKGVGVREIASNLKKEGLIKDPIVFFLVVKKLGLDNKIQAGDFRLTPAMKTVEIAENLTHGTLDVWITIPEGLRADEIADILKKEFPTYEESWRNQLVKNEGYLFPDTYLIPRDATVDLAISLMRSNFEKKYASIQTGNKSGLSQEDVVIVASMVEREAKLDADRPLVANVILNRLDIGMKLDIDATIQYALGYQPTQRSWWKRNLTLDDLALNSPYNTYKQNGLPPTPIANPGERVLRAVLNPASTNYLYYISDKTGKNRYAETLEQHNENIKKYGLL